MHKTLLIALATTTMLVAPSHALDLKVAVQNLPATLDPGKDHSNT
ncbi:MAG: hypothetical protein K0Q69_3131, partial [Devosia sp.]|nr:hypothetical protein [Devosia sp.]